MVQFVFFGFLRDIYINKLCGFFNSFESKKKSAEKLAICEKLEKKQFNLWKATLSKYLTINKFPLERESFSFHAGFPWHDWKFLASGFNIRW